MFDLSLHFVDKAELLEACASADKSSPPRIVQSFAETATTYVGDFYVRNIPLDMREDCDVPNYEALVASKSVYSMTRESIIQVPLFNYRVNKATFAFSFLLGFICRSRVTIPNTIKPGDDKTGKLKLHLWLTKEAQDKTRCFDFYLGMAFQRGNS